MGLVIHSLTDGIALGASLFFSYLISGQQSERSSSKLGLVIFFAILMHKIPASVGLGTFLQHSGLQNKALVKHLLAFTLSSPIACTITFIILCSMGLDS